MKVREKNKEIIWHSSRFNIHGIGEMIVENEDYGADSVFIKDYDAWIEELQQWKDMGQAFRDRDIIIDNYNTYFFEPSTEEDRARGFTL